MTENTSIEWANHTFNPWIGCCRVSPGCRFCYADTNQRRWGQDQLWRRHGPRRVTSDAYWRKPLSWNRDAERLGQPAKVFCASLADVFEDHPAVTEARKRLFGLIEETPWLRWLLLTKRIENVAGMVPWGNSWPASVWLGVSVENQRYASEPGYGRIPPLLSIRGPAVRFLSCEPLLGPVDLIGQGGVLAGGHDMYALPDPREHEDGEPVCQDHGAYVSRCCRCTFVDWVIVGGESGQRARPMRPEWVQSLRDQCVAAEVPFLFKQWGSVRWVAGSRYDEPTQCWVDHGIEPQRVSKKLAGRLLDGRTWDEFPKAGVAA